MHWVQTDRLLSIGRRMHWVQADRILYRSVAECTGCRRTEYLWAIGDYTGCRRIGLDRSILVVSNRLRSVQLGAIDRSASSLTFVAIVGDRLRLGYDRRC
jgi:hypothetical protein